MAEAPKRTRSKDMRERKPRFVLQLSDKGHARLFEMAEARGGYVRAKIAVIEEALTRMHAEDELLHGIKKRRVKRKEGES